MEVPVHPVEAPLSTLWFVPTELERARLLAAWRSLAGDVAPPSLEICGFGPIAAGIQVARHVERSRPQRVVLLGIGGSYDLAIAPLGAVVEIARVWTDAVGAERPPGEAADPWSRWELPSEMGFPQIAVGDANETEGLPAEVHEFLELDPQRAGVGLLTVGIASGSAETAAARRRRFGDPAVEDMEGFGVALACRLAGIPCEIWRAITNQVGDRQVKNWRWDSAFRSLAARLMQEMKTAGTGTAGTGTAGTGTAGTGVTGATRER